jgi:hypothetical protein
MELLKLGISNSTRSTYRSAIRSYVKFATHFQCNMALPIDAQDIVLWITYLFTANLSIGTVRTYLYGIASWHIEEGHSSPLLASVHVWRCWKGMKRWKGDGEKKVRRPITTSLLSKVQQLMNMHKAYDRMIWAAYTLGTYGLLRLGEFTIRTNKDDRILCWRHIDWFTSSGERVPLLNGKVNENAQEYRVLLESSKTDPFRRGVTIRILAPTAVKAMKSHCNGLTITPLFNAPVFDMAADYANKQKCVPMNRDTVVKSIQAHLTQLGEIGQHYNGHSFRKGGAQTLAEANVATDTIQTMGRWTSDCYKLYISTPSQTITSAALALEP